MLDTLRISFSLHTATQVNEILYSLQKLPLIGKALPENLYQKPKWKAFATVISMIYQLLFSCLGKLFFFLFILYLPNLSFLSGSDAFLQELFFFSLVGGFCNTNIFRAKNETYYAIMLLGIDAKKYALSRYFCDLALYFICYTVLGVYFGGKLSLSLFYCLLIPFSVVGIRLLVTALFLFRYQRVDYRSRSRGFSFLIWGLIAVFVFAALSPLITGMTLEKKILAVLMLITCFLGIFSLVYLLRYQGYRSLYAQIFRDFLYREDSKHLTLFQMQNLGLASEKMEGDSHKEGLEYLNELFVKRHKKILWQSSRRITMGAVLFFLVLGIGIYLFPEMTTFDSSNYHLSELIFILYAINRGMGYTRALFTNCDRSLFIYPVMRQPKILLKLFCIRLRELMKINLPPAFVIGLGVPVLLLISGAEKSLALCVPFFAALSLSIFFSMHYLTMYYLLQPYSVQMESKSPFYNLVQISTYGICLLLMNWQFSFSSLAFLTICGSLLYCPIALLLVFFLAPKTFRLR